ncbi:MAG: hypothetical protein FWD89_02940 [Firmicutes bacterium]|nr:hypothetical protein [Bacillota bacterium]
MNIKEIKKLKGGVFIHKSAVLEEGVKILPFCVIEEDVEIKSGCVIGPFARLRKGTRISENCKIGNFVEIKNSKIGKGTKINHHAYVGDATIGENVNIGAGVIFCNYDGKKKHETHIGNGVFVGSNVNLVAPLTIGEKAVIGAGSTIDKDVPAFSLAIARERQINKEGYVKQ